MAGTYVKEVQLAGILHDIGKFYQKSGRKGAEVAGIMVKGHHAQVSSSFIENYRKQFIKYDIDVDDILRFESELFEYVETKYPEIPETIRTKKVLDEETEKALVKAIEECKKAFK